MAALRPKGPRRGATYLRGLKGGHGHRVGCTREPPHHYAWAPYTGLTHPCLHCVCMADMASRNDARCRRGRISGRARTVRG
jgi:hypothetical protein